MNQEPTIYQFFINLLNVVGYSLFAAFLISRGLNKIFPKVFSSKKQTFIGLCMILFAILFLIQKI